MLISSLTVVAEKSSFIGRGAGLQALADFLDVVYSGSGAEYCESIERSFRLHIEPEETKQQQPGGSKRADGWTATKQTATKVTKATKATAKVLNFWCFNPGFGMRQLLSRNTRSIILTSGTLAPLRPLISELAMPVSVSLENPHIIDASQVYVKVVSHGPDKVELNSSYRNRSNPAYVASLGRTVLSLCPVTPGGLLVFFPSYQLLNKCSEEWQATGIWAQISRIKPIYVEPRGKDTFTTTMGEYYGRLREPSNRGAIFMAVCRGKVSEGLDFADANGRAVMITGLPFPPLMDARVVLKKEYLDQNRNEENMLISGNDWYGLEASRAVNQAIGRVIRHKDDYGAILLCDSRFQNPRQQAQLSLWIHGHLRNDHTSGGPPNFGKVVGELSRFFRSQSVVREKVRDVTIKQEAKLIEELPCSSQAAISPFDNGYVMFHKRERNSSSDATAAAPFAAELAKRKKRKLVILPNSTIKYENSPTKEGAPEPTAPANRVDFLREVKQSLPTHIYKMFLQAMSQYSQDGEFTPYIQKLYTCFDEPHLLYLLKAMRRFVKQEHREQFDAMMATRQA